MRLPRFDIFLVNKLVLALFDVLALALAYALALAVRGYYFRTVGFAYEITIRHAYFLCLLTVLILFFFRNMHLYRDVAFRRSAGHLVILTRSWLMFAGIFIAISFFFKVQLFSEHRLTVLLLIVFGWLFLYLGRFLLASSIIRLLMRTMNTTNRILVVGPPSEVAAVMQHVGEHRDGSHQVVGYISTGEAAGGGDEVQAPWLGSVAALKDVLAEQRITEIFISGVGADWHVLFEVINRARRAGVVVRVALPHFGEIGQRVPDMPEFTGGYVYLNNSFLIGAERVAKRLLDFAVALSAILLLSPLLALVALAIRLDSRGTILFRQARVGLNGRPFTVLKFRTMSENTEEHHKEAVRRLIKGEHAQVKAQSDSGQIYKVTQNSKVTRVGRLLRRSSLDELPQLFNVLAGEMSLVGPRPLPAYEVEHFAPWQHLRHVIKPGITGFWQAYARSAVKHQDMVLMDIFYAVNWSLSLDFRILVRTFFTMLSGGGAV